MLSKNASGAVVANDAVTARQFTRMMLSTGSGGEEFSSRKSRRANVTIRVGEYVRSNPCDVPCSGDGTLRKSTDLWKKWSNSSGESYTLDSSERRNQGVEIAEIRRRRGKARV